MQVFESARHSTIVLGCNDAGEPYGFFVPPGVKDRSGRVDWRIERSKVYLPEVIDPALVETLMDALNEHGKDPRFYTP